MAATLNHRGPDDSGTWTDAAGVALGHQRLSILVLLQHGEPEIRPYWELRKIAAAAQAERLNGSEKEAVDGLESLLRDAVRRRMVADDDRWSPACNGPQYAHGENVVGFIVRQQEFPANRAVGDQARSNGRFRRMTRNAPLPDL